MTTLREQCYSVIDGMSDSQISALMNFFKDVQRVHDKDLEELLDDEFCIALAERYDRYADKDDPGTPIEVLAEKWGIDLEADDE